MLLPETYSYLRYILDTRPRLHTVQIQRQWLGDFTPQHTACHLTAVQAALETGEVPIVGIQFLERTGKLYPWPHMVNRAPFGLANYSPPISERNFGFIETGWHEFQQWRDVTLAYYHKGAYVERTSWGDPLADALTHDYLEKLRGSSEQLP